MESVGLNKKGEKSVSSEKADTDPEDEAIDWEAKIREAEQSAFSGKRARAMASPDAMYMLVGSIGAILAGGVFPMWGILFGQTIGLLFRPVLPCSAGSIPNGEASCEAYWDSEADFMRHKSFQVAGYWVILCVVGCLFGNMVTYYGFGVASERLSKRLRDTAFMALMRQEPAFFDKRSVGSITSQLQDDAARIQAFSGEPVRSFIIAMASILTGVVLSLYYMWPFALLAIGCIPVMAMAVSVQHSRMMGTNELGANNIADELNSPGGIIVETLLNIRTVSALTLENRRFNDYERALAVDEGNYRKEAFMGGLTNGLSMFIQQWVNGLQFYFGGWLLYTFPQKYNLNDFLVAQFAILFGLFGLGAAFQDMSDRKEVEKSAGRIFYLLDRQSEIDPLSTEGKKL
jgi:ATP-binding cassette subfamily B (MDR/TAP) protein 1